MQQFLVVLLLTCGLTAQVTCTANVKPLHCQIFSSIFGPRQHGDPNYRNVSFVLETQEEFEQTLKEEDAAIQALTKRMMGKPISEFYSPVFMSAGLSNNVLFTRKSKDEICPTAIIVSSQVFSPGRNIKTSDPKVTLPVPMEWETFPGEIVGFMEGCRAMHEAEIGVLPADLPAYIRGQ